MPTKSGRKPGSPNSVNPVGDALKEALPGKIPRKRAPQEFFQGHKHTTIKLDSISHAVLEIHARRRKVPLSWLVQDILNLWSASVTDYDQAIFRDMLPPKARAARTPERYSGYIDGLGFAPQSPQPTEAPTPGPSYQELPPSEPIYPAVPVPSLQQHPTLNDLQQPYRHPMTTGPATYPHPAPTLPGTSGLFNEDYHNSITGPTGHGSAALEATQGEAPDDSKPLKPKEVEAYMDFYRVKPEDVR